MRAYQHEITENEEKTYRDLENQAREIDALVNEFELAVLGADLPMEVKAAILARVEHGFGYLAYMMHPQSEWTGGDSFRTRPPHIANVR